MLIDFVGQFLVVDLEQFNRLLQRFKHLIGGRLAVFHPVQDADDVDQCVVAAILQWLGQLRVNLLDECRQVFQTAVFNTINCIIK